MSYFLCLLNLICTVLNSISDGNFLVLYRSVWAGQVCLLWEALRGKQVYQEQPVIAQCTNTLSLSLCSVVCPFVCVCTLFFVLPTITAFYALSELQEIPTIILLIMFYVPDYYLTHCAACYDIVQYLFLWHTYRQ